MQNRRAVEMVFAAIGVALVGAAAAANQPWLDRHFLPSFFMPHRWYILIETIVRATIGAVGLLLASAARRPLAAAIARSPRATLHVILAAGLALVASELVLRRVHLRPTEWLVRDEEPRRQPDRRLGWVLAPGRVGISTIGGRRIEYAIDAAGDRVARVEQPVDRKRPTVVFIGESVIFGEGLTWDETIPAQTGAMLGLQSANLAVHGYSNDQAYMRLESELPRFRKPVAVVSLFMTALFGRNLDDDRPHLGPGLVWIPAQQPSRLAVLAGLVVPYRTDETVDRGVRMTREVLRGMVDLARTRGAEPLVVVPQFGPEADSERTLRERILGNGVPFQLVTLDAGWRLPWDRHPNARAAHAIAAAIAARLRQRLDISH